MQRIDARSRDFLMGHHYEIREVDATDPAIAQVLHDFNALEPRYFPPLSHKHFSEGYWWIVYHCSEAVAMCGLVPNIPFEWCGYLKRCYVVPEHRGNGLQERLIGIRELKAKDLGWEMLVTDCHHDNKASYNSLCRKGYSITHPEQPWSANSIYFAKRL